MKSEIRRFGILRAGVVGAILYGFFGVLWLPFAIIAAVARPVPGIMFVVMAVCYPLMGFVAGVLFAALYNLAAKIGGGLQLELVQVQDGYQPAGPGEIPPGPQSGPPTPEVQGPPDGRSYAPPGYYD